MKLTAFFVLLLEFQYLVLTRVTRLGQHILNGNEQIVCTEEGTSLYMKALVICFRMADALFAACVHCKEGLRLLLIRTPIFLSESIDWKSIPFIL